MLLRLTKSNSIGSEYFFTPDCFIDYTKVGGISGNLEEIISYLELALKHFPNYQHMISNISIDFDESNNSAIGKVMCFNPMEDKKGKYSS